MATDFDRRVAALREQWPRPRISERIRLNNGRVGEVVTVRAARQVLKGLTEAQALVLSSSLAARFGEHWPEVYYEVDLYFSKSGKLVTANTRDVDEILPPL